MMICEFVMEVGNMGHNRDMSYHESVKIALAICEVPSSHNVGFAVRNTKGEQP